MDPTNVSSTMDRIHMHFHDVPLWLVKEQTLTLVESCDIISELLPLLDDMEICNQVAQSSAWPHVPGLYSMSVELDDSGNRVGKFQSLIFDVSIFLAVYANHRPKLHLPNTLPSACLVHAAKKISC